MEAAGYDVTICEAADTISIIEEGAQLWDFTMIGGTTEPATQALLTFNVYLPDTIDTGHRHQVKINQISMTMEDGTSVTARTRNGLIGVFRRGDTNGDDVVDVLDQVNQITHILGKESDVFIEEVSNINGDEELDILDAVGIVEIILNKQE